METFQQEFTVQKIHLDCFNRVKPSVMLHFVMRTVSAHCAPLGVGWETLWAKNLTWVVGRTRLQITRAPQLDETVVIETWPMPATRSAFPRTAVARTPEGEELYRCTTLWALMDKTTRKLVLPRDSDVHVPGLIRGDELPVPNSFAATQADSETQRLVCFSDLDTNGHTNNTRYLEWINDMFSSEFHKAHPFKDVTLCYLSEAREGQTVRLTQHFFEDGSLQVDGLRPETDDLTRKPRVFSAIIKF